MKKSRIRKVAIEVRKKNTFEKDAKLKVLMIYAL